MVPARLIARFRTRDEADTFARAAAAIEGRYEVGVGAKRALDLDEGASSPLRGVDVVADRVELHPQLGLVPGARVIYRVVTVRSGSWSQGDNGCRRRLRRIRCGGLPLVGRTRQLFPWLSITVY